MAVKIGKDESVANPLDESLAVLQPDKTYVKVEGEDIEVKPYTFGKLLRALKHLSKLSGIFEGSQENIEANLMRGLSEHGDDVLELISLATDLPIVYFDSIDAGEGLDLAVATYKVNESFFVKNLLPKLQELFPSDLQTPEQEVEVKTKAKKAGSTSSKS
jgi:hypothetical protein